MYKQRFKNKMSGYRRLFHGFFFSQLIRFAWKVYIENPVDGCGRAQCGGHTEMQFHHERYRGRVDGEEAARLFYFQQETRGAPRNIQRELHP